MLRRTAGKLDHLSDDIATSEVGCRHPEMQQIRISSAGWTRHFRVFRPSSVPTCRGFPKEGPRYRQILCIPGTMWHSIRKRLSASVIVRGWQRCPSAVRNLEVDGPQVVGLMHWQKRLGQRHRSPKRKMQSPYCSVDVAVSKAVRAMRKPMASYLVSYRELRHSRGGKPMQTRLASGSTRTP